MAEDASSAPVKTPLLLLWTSTTLFWSIFTPPLRTFAARLLLFQPLWLVRALVADDPTWTQDLFLCLGLHALYAWSSGAWTLMTIPEVVQWLNFHDPTTKVYLQVFALLGGCAGLAGSIVHRGSRLDANAREGLIHEQRIDESLLDPLLITSRTTHARMFPEKHAFSYSYLLVGIPIGFQGRIGNVLSVDSLKHAWFDVRSSDYLTRGGIFLGLGGKLKRFLHSHGVTDRDYAFAYLVTAPRFLGYSFNPVSFWYIYDADVKLKYMILEVNNTFDERRMYLLDADGSSDRSSQNADESAESSQGTVFSKTFEKDFHVSPFNSRKGSYSLRAVDPLAAFQETGQVRIDNTIVLRSSKDSPKIVARVCSDGAPRDPAQVTPSELLNFVLAWWWVGLMTFPRIVWEAQKLFFRKKLKVWFRPEVTTTSIGRSYTDDEALLESCFHNFLTHVVEHSRKPLRVIYEPAQHSHEDGHVEEIVLYSPAFTYEEDKSRTLTIKVLSPAFYSRFVHYAHAKEAFDRECLATDDKNRTVIVESAHVLPVLLAAIQDADRGPNTTPAARVSLTSRMRWHLLRRLRCPPAAPSYPGDDSSSKHVDHDSSTVRDIRAFPLSELDRYVRAHSEDADAYRRTVGKLFLAARLGLGIPPLIVLCDVLLRSALLLLSMVYSDRARVFDVLRPRPFKTADFGPGAVALVLANGVHWWAFFKG